MINKIGAIGNSYHISKINFKENSSQNLVTKPSEDYNNKGLEALAVYNKSYTEDLNIKPSALIYNQDSKIEDITGERISTSDGKLHSIIKNDEKTKTIYKFDFENEIESVKVFDKQSGNLIKEQIDNDAIFEYDPKTSKITKRTEFEDGVPVYVSKSIYKNGKERNICHDIKNNDYYTYETNTKTNDTTITDFDKNKQLTNITTYKERGATKETLRVSFYNGSMISTAKEITKTIPNTMGRDAMNLENLEPHQKFEKPQDDLRAMQGEKTYYSNGYVETNIIKLSNSDDNSIMTCTFSPDGKLEKLFNGSKEIIFKDNNEQVITETLSDGSIKQTNIFDDGAKVEVRSGKFGKSVLYDNKGNITMYQDNEKSLYFNKEGMLEDAFKNNY